MSKATEALEALLTENGEHTTKRLSFSEKCALFFVLKKSFNRNDPDPSNRSVRLKQNIMAKAFGVPPNVVSNLSRAIETGARSQRAIAEEFEKLGEREFGEKYFTDTFADSLVKARSQSKHSGRQSFAGLYIFQRVGALSVFVDIRQHQNGWAYAVVTGHEGDTLVFDEEFGEEPTHTEALDYFHEAELKRCELRIPAERIKQEHVLSMLKSRDNPGPDPDFWQKST